MPENSLEKTNTSPYNKGQRWNMPARNFVQTFVLPAEAGANLTVVFFDASPCLLDYRQTKHPNRWSPQNTNGDKRFNFSSNIRAEPCQNVWLDSVLAAVPTTNWLVVVAHELAYQIDAFDMVALLAKYKVALYLNGHAHRLSHQQNNGRNFVTTGAGCMNAGDVAVEKPGFKVLFDNNSTAGFTAHYFQNDYKTLLTSFLDSVGDCFGVLKYL
jgi:hypothetical protein